MSEMGQNWFRYWLVAYSAPIHYLNQLLPIRPWGTDFGKNIIKIQTFSFTKMHLKISSVKWRPFCSGDEELNFVLLQQRNNSNSSNSTVTIISSICGSAKGTIHLSNSYSVKENITSQYFDIRSSTTNNHGSQYLAVITTGRYQIIYINIPIHES